MKLTKLLWWSITKVWHSSHTPSKLCMICDHSIQFNARGGCKHHTFEMFINKFTSTYQDLSDFDEEVNKGKKIQDFLEATKTPLLDAGKAQDIAMTPTVLMLESVTNYMAHFVESQSTMQQKVAGTGHEGGERDQDADVPEAVVEENLKFLHKTLTMMSGDNSPLKQKLKVPLHSAAPDDDAEDDDHDPAGEAVNQMKTKKKKGKI
eukprot:scaffold55554_cov58-Attheya_sp.AAC.3